MAPAPVESIRANGLAHRPLQTAFTLIYQNEPSLRVYISGDGSDVYEDNFMRIANPDGTDFRPTLVLVGTRLGIDQITPVYWEAFVALLQMSQSVGVAGGRPSSSHYFFGAQGLYLFYLDPHHTRPAFPYYSDPAQYADKDINSCHTSRLRRIHVREIDQSMLIGFLIRSEDDWLNWRTWIKHLQGKAFIHVTDRSFITQGYEGRREDAIEEVETISDTGSDIVATEGYK